MRYAMRWAVLILVTLLFVGAGKLYEVWMREAPPVEPVSQTTNEVDS